jgi:hypothetical protein
MSMKNADLPVYLFHDAAPVDMAVEGAEILTRVKGIHGFSKVVPERFRTCAVR